jgi:hypothetical protein
VYFVPKQSHSCKLGEAIAITILTPNFDSSIVESARIQGDITQNEVTVDVTTPSLLDVINLATVNLARSHYLESLLWSCKMLVGSRKAASVLKDKW